MRVTHRQSKFLLAEKLQIFCKISQEVPMRRVQTQDLRAMPNPDPSAVEINGAGPLIPSRQTRMWKRYQKAAMLG
jgi:hypothetical protein